MWETFLTFLVMYLTIPMAQFFRALGEGLIARTAEKRRAERFRQEQMRPGISGQPRTWTDTIKVGTDFDDRWPFDLRR